MVSASGITCTQLRPVTALLTSIVQLTQAVLVDAEIRLDSNGLVLVDMGQHVVQDYPQPLALHQVLLPGLEDRARAFPPLNSARQLAPGMLLDCVLPAYASYP